MPTAPRISVIVPCRGHAAELRRCLAALERQQIDLPYEVIVVDSAADPAVVAATRPFKRVRVLSSPRPLYGDPARNLGAAAARGAVLAFTDADCEPAPGWLAAAYGALRDGAVLVGGPVGDALPRHPVAVADNLLQFADFSPRRPAGPAAYFPTCNIALCRDIFCEVGGIPEPGAVLGADTLFTAAVARRCPDGARFIPAMRVDHRGRTTPRQLWRHMHSFGYGRARLNLRLRPALRRLGRHAILMPAVAARRWLYLAGQVARSDPARLPRFLLLTPLLALGLLGWAAGFRDGCREPLHPLAMEDRP